MVPNPDFETFVFRKNMTTPKASELEILADIKVPTIHPRLYAPKMPLVFVDPDDNESQYWWPAMIVPQEEW